MWVLKLKLNKGKNSVSALRVTFQGHSSHMWLLYWMVQIPNIFIRAKSSIGQH